MEVHVHSFVRRYTWENSLCMYVQQRIVTTNKMDISFIFTSYDMLFLR
jgi:hypothetical protein